MRFALVLSLFALPLAQNARAKCAPIGLQPEVINPKGIAIPADGGLVLAAESKFDDFELPKGDVTEQRAWRFRSGKKLVEPTIERLAPGLAVYRFDAKTKLELENADHKLVGSATRTTNKPALPAAPKVTKIHSTRHRDGKRMSTDVEVMLDGAPPASAIAIVALNKDGVAISFGRVVKGEPLLVFKERRCELVSDGTVEPKSGMFVTVFWVDSMGRKSPASKPIAITSSGTATMGEE